MQDTTAWGKMDASGAPVVLELRGVGAAHEALSDTQRNFKGHGVLTFDERLSIAFSNGRVTSILIDGAGVKDYLALLEGERCHYSFRPGRPEGESNDFGRLPGDLDLATLATIVRVMEAPGQRRITLDSPRAARRIGPRTVGHALALARSIPWREGVLTLEGKIELGFEGGRACSARLSWSGIVEYLAMRSRAGYFHRYTVRDTGIAIAPCARGAVLTISAERVNNFETAVTGYL